MASTWSVCRTCGHWTQDASGALHGPRFGKPEHPNVPERGPSAREQPILTALVGMAKSD